MTVTLTHAEIAERSESRSLFDLCHAAASLWLERQESAP